MTTVLRIDAIIKSYLGYNCYKIGILTHTKVFLYKTFIYFILLNHEFIETMKEIFVKLKSYVQFLININKTTINVRSVHRLTYNII